MTLTPAVLAAHRFGLGEPSLEPLRSDPRGWVWAQLRSPAPMEASGLLGADAMLALNRQVLRTALQGAPAMPGAPRPSASGPDGPPGPAALRGMADPDRRRLAAAGLDDLLRRWQHAITTPTPVAERWTLFWANHFTVAATRGTMLGMVGPFEREAIRPQAFGRFADLLKAATRHPSMLLYLDNAASVGPGSRLGRRRDRGLNENLARELLELHTLGVGGGYTQDDVTETARLLTGWTVPRGPAADRPADPAATGIPPPADDRADDPAAVPAAPTDRTPPRPAAGVARFVAALHEPGPKRVLGRTYPEGPQALDLLLDDLARHPATARHLATQLARHFVADDPPAPLVEALAARHLATEGDLPELAHTLFAHPLAWQAGSPPKFKRPEEWVLGAHRMLQRPIANVAAAARLAAALAEMGQPPARAPSPQGWPDRRADWLAPDALWKRVEWAARFAQAAAEGGDARALAQASLGPALRPATRAELDRAASPAQALALWLTSPEVLQR